MLPELFVYLRTVRFKPFLRLCLLNKAFTLKIVIPSLHPNLYQMLSRLNQGFNLLRGLDLLAIIPIIFPD